MSNELIRELADSIEKQNQSTAIQLQKAKTLKEYSTQVLLEGLKLSESPKQDTELVKRSTKILEAIKQSATETSELLKMLITERNSRSNISRH
jgi:hypothetical protein